MTQDQQLDLPLPPRVRVRLLDTDFPAERSPWESSDYPPMPGWWEVRDRLSSVFLGRWWWEGTRWLAPLRHSLARVLNHQEFRKQCDWRGLREPAPDIYPCPPYSSAVLLPAAQHAGVALRTLHAIITRARVRIEE